MLLAQNRPRNLRWFHAGPLLFGDWGTSRLYVLGLAFYYTAHASLLYMSVMSLVMAAVAWAYTVVCRSFPDGGGVYAASRRINPTLSVIGATLLLCDYIVTAALSAVEGFHYFGVPGYLVVPLVLGTIVAIGFVNWTGARSAGRFALSIAILSIAASAVIALLCLPLVPKGLSEFTTRVDGLESPWARWESLVRIVLALSGVEAVANMTGLMKPPVGRTASRTIWPVLIEVVVLNLIFMAAISALPQLEHVTTPDYVAYELRMGVPSDAVPPDVKEYRDTAVKILATETASRVLGAEAGRLFGVVAGILFGVLLLSAVNTAVMAMVAVQYSLARDGELPPALTRLNYSGVPWIGLFIACALPMAVVAIEADVKVLGELYAIGVVGAIAINLFSCAANSELPVKRWERRALWALAALMAAIELTIIVAKPTATIFAGSIVGAVLVMRSVLRWRARLAAEVELPEPATGWLAEVRAAPAALDPNRPRIMLAARGRYQAEFAVDLARRRGAILFVIYVRTLRLLDIEPGRAPRVEDDRSAQEALGTAATLARRAGVPFVPIYVISPEIPEEILDYTVTYGCDTLVMGATRRSLFARRVAGDVVQRVSELLPQGVSLITRRGDTPFEPVVTIAADDPAGEPPPT